MSASAVALLHVISNHNVLTVNFLALMDAIVQMVIVLLLRYVLAGATLFSDCFPPGLRGL